jgi:DNA-binding PucR family transcriptional regulator
MDRWDALQSWRLLLEAPESLTPEDLQPNVTKLFQPGQAELLKTAEVFFDLGGDVQSATEALLVHRTTFYYRLGKISDLIGVNLQNDRDKSNLDLALKLQRIRAIRHL